MDDGLTNLNWLPGLDAMGMRPHGEQSYEDPSPKSASVNDSGHRLAAATSPTPQQTVTSPFNDVTATFSFSNAEYKNSASVKPPFSYSQLIFMSMAESGKGKVTLHEIYTWIANNFLYYKQAESTWQNSVRHNLSLSKCFVKLPRDMDQPGKGGCWSLNPRHVHISPDGRMNLVKPSMAIDASPARRNRRSYYKYPMPCFSPSKNAEETAAFETLSCGQLLQTIRSENARERDSADAVTRAAQRFKNELFAEMSDEVIRSSSHADPLLVKGRVGAGERDVGTPPAMWWDVIEPAPSTHLSTTADSDSDDNVAQYFNVDASIWEDHSQTTSAFQ